jgi:hypothetical protein
MTCGVHGIYLKFGSFNSINPIVPYYIYKKTFIAVHIATIKMSLRGRDLRLLLLFVVSVPVGSRQSIGS